MGNLAFGLKLGRVLLSIVDHSFLSSSIDNDSCSYAVWMSRKNSIDLDIWKKQGVFQTWSDNMWTANTIYDMPNIHESNTVVLSQSLFISHDSWLTISFSPKQTNPDRSAFI